MSRGRYRELRMQLEGYRLATAEILYHLPDHPSLLQSFIWQQYDLVPEYPNLRRFLDWWDAHLDGKIHSVHVCAAAPVRPSGWRHIPFAFELN